MRPQDIVSARDACQLLGISRPTLYSWIEQGKLKPWGKVGGNDAWLFLRNEVKKAQGRKYERTQLSSISKTANQRKFSRASE